MEMSDLPKYVPTDHSGLVRDTETNAILVTDRRALEEHRRRRKNYESTKTKLDSINSIQEDVDSLKNDMAEIKSMLQSLVLKD